MTRSQDKGGLSGAKTSWIIARWRGLSKSSAMTKIFAERSAEKRRVGEALIREADNLACQSWNEKMWSDGGPAQPSPTIGQAIDGGFPWLEVKCSRCRTPSSVDLAAISRPPDTPVHLLEGRLDCRKCKKAKWKGRGVLEQLAPRRRYDASETG